MFITDLIARDCVDVDVKVTSKKQLIQELARLIAECACLENEVKTGDIISAAMERERLGSTGVGSGVALPHARIEGLSTVRAAIVRLETPVDFEAVDERPVDLAVMILAPVDAGGDHLRALAQISRRLRKEDLRAKLRNAPDAESLYVLFTEEEQANAA